MSSFYGEASVTAFLKDYVSTFYLPVFEVKDGVLTIKNFSKDFTSTLEVN